MNDEEIMQIIEKAAIVAAEAAARAAVAAVKAVLGVETQAAIEAASGEAARIGAQIGAEASVKAVEIERRRYRETRNDRRFRNTKLLLRNYRMLSASCSNAVYDAASETTREQGVEEIIEAMEELFDEGIQVESIMKTAIRTQFIMDHLDRMLGVYKVYCQQSPRAEEQRHFRIIEALYLSEHRVTAGELAKQERIDKRTVYKDVDAACATLSALIFGIDGISRQ